MTRVGVATVLAGGGLERSVRTSPSSVRMSTGAVHPELH
jgi:hypothetical protein